MPIIVIAIVGVVLTELAMWLERRLSLAAARAGAILKPIFPQSCRGGASTSLSPKGLAM
jgi:hypothetical protein